MHQRSALRTALLPAIDSTKVVGLISLPGAMTGLILAGVDLLTAIRHQIVAVDMLLAATALAALATARLAEHALFDHAHRLAPYSKRLACEATKSQGQPGSSASPAPRQNRIQLIGSPRPENRPNRQ